MKRVMLLGIIGLLILITPIHALFFPILGISDSELFEDKTWFINESKGDLKDNGGYLEVNGTWVSGLISDSSTTYYLNSSAVTGGSYTDGSDVTSAWYYDGASLNFTEGGGADPLDIYLNFTNVNDIDQLVMREYYLGSSSHFIQVQIWDYVDSAWEDYFEFVGQTGFTIISIPVFDATDHIDSGNVQVRLHHVQNGITSHRLYIDFVWLVEGNNIGGSTNLDGYARYSFGYNDFSGTGNFNTSGNIYDNGNRVCTSDNALCDTSLTDYWNTSLSIDQYLSANEIDDGKIDFNTTCTSTQKYYSDGNDLVCNDDDFLTQEEVEDYVGAMATNGDGVDFAYSDAAGTLTPSFDCSDVTILSGGTACLGEDIVYTCATVIDVFGDGLGCAGVASEELYFDCSDVADNTQGTDCDGEDLIHADTSSFAPGSNGYLTNVTTDTYGHVQTETYTQVGYHTTTLSGDGNITVVIII